jgi:hypothetical protein
MDTKKDKETLDMIGRELFRRRDPASKVVEHAIADPDLFAGVLKRINQEPKPVRAGFRLYAATLSSVAVLTIAAIAGVSLLRSGGKELAVNNTIQNSVPASSSVPVTAPPDLPPPSDGFEDDGTLQGGATYRPTRSERPVMQNASYTSTRADKLPQPKARPITRDEFYGLTYGEPADTDGGRIVRVDMTRASLFAMGVNVPLENDSETVKADLLIGPDGVTRAIRVVK